MVRDIAALMKAKLLSLYDPQNGVITNISGLVRVKDVEISTGVIRKVPFAIDCLEEPENCPECTEPLFDLVPDSGKRCIVYFEQVKTTTLQVINNGAKYNSIISLICWFDSRMFAEQEELTSKLIALFISKIKTPFLTPQTSVLSGVQVVGYTPTDSDPIIFSKYTYSDFRKPFLGCPHGYFKIDFSINYLTNETCLPTHNPIALADCC